MMAVCRRYLGAGPDAEDALMEGFMKVFPKSIALKRMEVLRDGYAESW